MTYLKMETRENFEIPIVGLRSTALSFWLTSLMCENNKENLAGSVGVEPTSEDLESSMLAITPRTQNVL